MIEKGFLNRTNNRDSKNKRYASNVSKAMLCLGIGVVVSSLVYMIINFAIADSIVMIWLPFMIAGLFMVFISQLIKWKWRGSER